MAGSTSPAGVESERCVVCGWSADGSAGDGLPYVPVHGPVGKALPAVVRAVREVRTGGVGDELDSAGAVTRRRRGHSVLFAGGLAGTQPADTRGSRCCRSGQRGRWCPGGGWFRRCRSSAVSADSGAFGGVSLMWPALNAFISGLLVNSSMRRTPSVLFCRRYSATPVISRPLRAFLELLLLITKCRSWPSSHDTSTLSPVVVGSICTLRYRQSSRAFAAAAAGSSEICRYCSGTPSSLFPAASLYCFWSPSHRDAIRSRWSLCTQFTACSRLCLSVALTTAMSYKSRTGAVCPRPSIFPYRICELFWTSSIWPAISLLCRACRGRLVPQKMSSSEALLKQVWVG